MARPQPLDEEEVDQVRPGESQSVHGAAEVGLMITSALIWTSVGSKIPSRESSSVPTPSDPVGSCQD